MSVRRNQKSVYVDEDVQKAWETFASRYSRVPFTDVVNAAMREYFERCRDGVDGNLKPLLKESKSK